MSELKYELLLKTGMKPVATEFLRTTRSHPAVSKWLFSDCKQITRADQESWYRSYCILPDYKIYLATDCDSGLYVGYTSFFIRSLSDRRCELGYVVHPDYMGKGYGGLMLARSIGMAREMDGGMRRLELKVLKGNETALKLYRAAGFEQEGVLKDYVFKDGEYRNVLSLVMLI